MQISLVIKITPGQSPVVDVIAQSADYSLTKKII